MRIMKTRLGGSYNGAKLAACLWVFSKGVKNNWAPPYGEERIITLVQDLIRICNRVEEETCVGIRIPLGSTRTTDSGKIAA